MINGHIDVSDGTVYGVRTMKIFCRVFRVVKYEIRQKRQFSYVFKQIGVSVIHSYIRV
jgi:hypothetical protein